MNIKTRKIIQSFIVGSSFPVFIYFFLRVAQIPKNYSYEFYSLVNPLYFGILNSFVTYLHENNQQINRDTLYLYTSVASTIFVFILANVTQSYNFEKKSRISYFITLLVTHFITFNLIIKNLEQLVTNI